jgi:methylated-DNA-protein-cysteine methyltransferase-like protein
MKTRSLRTARRSPTAGVPKFARAVYAVVRDIPRGTVVTYGQVAAILGQPRAARAVGTALSHLPRALARIVPWQRVINASGRISMRGDVLRPDLQRQLLEMEGIRFRGGHIDLRAQRWSGPTRERPVRLAVTLPFAPEGRRATRKRRQSKRSRS